MFYRGIDENLEEKLEGIVARAIATELGNGRMSQLPFVYGLD